MDIVRTTKGTATSKTSGTTLTLNNVSMNPGQALVVAVGYDTGQGAPVVKWGQRSLRNPPGLIQAQNGAAIAFFILSHINNTAQRNIVATWGGAITAKALFALATNVANVVNVSAKQGQTTTTSPDTTSTTSTIADTLSIAAFLSQGPSSDTVGTVGSGHASGQRAGTVGAPPASNITLHETFEILSATGTIQSTKTGATSRNWASVVMALRDSSGTQKQGVTQSDIIAVGEKFEDESLDYSNHAYHFNDELNRWEVYVADITTTLVAHSGNNWV